MFQTLLALISLSIVTLVMPGLAQTPAQPDRNGNYSSNRAAVLGQAENPLAPGFLWQVISPGLNCRSAAGVAYPIVHQFAQGDLLQADLGRGGSDEVLQNAVDGNGNPWMRVRSSIEENYDCYVRANRRYVQPYREE